MPFRPENSYGLGYKHLYQSNKYHIISHRDSNKKAMISIEPNDCNLISSFKKDCLSKSIDFTKCTKRKEINMEDIRARRPNEKRFNLL